MKFNDLVGFLGLVIALIILWQFHQILLLVFTAVVLAIALNSLVRRLVVKLGVPRGRAVLIALGLVLLGGTALLVLVVPQFINQFHQLLQKIPKGFEQFVDWVDALMETPPNWLPTPEEMPALSDLIQQIGTFAGTAFGNFLTFFSDSFTVLLQLLLVIVLTLMILADPIAYRNLLLRLFPSFYRRRADKILSKCEIALLGWMGGVSFNSLFVATLCGVGLFALRVEFAFTHAVVAGVFNFVPNIGPFLSVVFPLSVALLDSVGKAIGVIILYLIVQNLESYWFSPMVMMQQVKLLPAATLIAQLFFTTFFGPLGLILALPLAVITKTWLEEAWVKDILDQRKIPPKQLEPLELPPQELPPQVERLPESDLSRQGSVEKGVKSQESEDEEGLMLEGGNVRNEDGG
ncbi:MAG: AI-2E family transporter [Leptolyngbyaceae cyanobacterium MO_188.B28]|nr:AI-2E family transporter [Leptolyngbyaceae cyanobacterium MO_188.B28]